MPEKRRRMSSYGDFPYSMSDTQLAASRSAGPGRYGRGRRGRMVRTKRYPRFRGVLQPVQYFTRTAYRTGVWSAASGSGLGIGFNFRLDNLPNFAEFTTLYDQYCIKGIKVELIPRCTEANPQTPNAIGNVWSAIDRDDSTSPAAVTDVLQYQNVKRTQMTDVHTRYFKPSVAMEMYSSIGGTAYGERQNTWIDCSNAAVEHYGLKVWSDGLPVGAAPIFFDVVTTFYLAFKNVR